MLHNNVSYIVAGKNVEVLGNQKRDTTKFFPEHQECRPRDVDNAVQKFYIKQ